MALKKKMRKKARNWIYNAAGLFAAFHRYVYLLLWAKAENYSSQINDRKCQGQQ